MLKVRKCNDFGVCSYTVLSGRKAVRELVKAYRAGKLKDLVIVPDHVVLRHHEEYPYNYRNYKTAPQSYS